MSAFNINPTAKQMCDAVDQFLPDDEAAVKAFLTVLFRFVDTEDDCQALDFEVVRNYAISKTSSYAQFVSQFTGTPVMHFTEADTNPNEEGRELVH